MLRIVLRAIALCVAVAGVAACKTNDGGIARIDKVRGEVSLYTTNDRRAVMQATTSNEDLRDIEKKLKQDLRGNPDDVSGNLDLAKIQLAQGKLKEAEASCQRALRFDLKNKEARKVLAQVYLRRGNYEMASIFLSDVAPNSTKDSNVLNMLALIELHKDNNSRAMALFKQAIKINPSDLAARMNLGVMLLKYRQVGSAAVQFERILKVMPGHKDAKLHLAIIRTSQGKYGEAEAMFGEVLAADDKNPLALYNLAVLRKGQKDYDEALDHLKVYLKSARGKATDNDKVFALINDIQRFKAAQGDKVSDEEIQQMASQMGTGVQDEGSARQVAKAEKRRSSSGDQVAPLEIPRASGDENLDELSELEAALEE